MTTTATRPHRPTRGTTSPLQPHGTSARAIGRPAQGIPGCKCPPCKAAKRKADKKRALLNATGRPVRVPAQPVTDHVRALLAAGMGWPRIARAARCSSCTIQRLLAGQELIKRSVADRILAVKARPAPGRHVDPTGSRRRIQALMAIGHTMVRISAEAAVDQSILVDVLHGHVSTVRGVTVDRIAAAYDWLSGKPAPADRFATRSRNRAAREGWAPPAAWEEAAIDDPQAHPEWTGYCGTHRGWHMHRLQKLPMCVRCEAAHEQWTEANRHLTPVELRRLLFGERQTVSERGRALADDARELFRQGYDRETAADRLGLTRDYLGTILRRYPGHAEADGEEAADQQQEAA